MGAQKFYLQENVVEAALERIRWVFREFQNIYVSFSGGKDSTVVLALTLRVAEELGRLPVAVQFTDQDAEWQCVIDYVRTVMHDPRVSPRWLQVPIKITHATSTIEPWLYCWDPAREADWMRPKEPDSITRNVYGVDRFKEMFVAFLRYHHPTKPAASLGGVRCEESPARTMGLTTTETYRGVTWGKANDARRKHFAFYPIYDWSYTDVWKYIHEHGLAYCSLYDRQYQYGVPIQNMRVSSVQHETATKALWYLQEVEPETWNKLTNRVRGANMVGHLRQSFLQPKELPFMFKDWWEYRDYLLVHMVPEQDQPILRKQFASFDGRYSGTDGEDLVKIEIGAILTHDLELTKLSTFTSAHKTNKRKAKIAEAAEVAAQELADEDSL